MCAFVASVPLHLAMWALLETARLCRRVAVRGSGNVPGLGDAGSNAAPI